jgi:hypothetical protein
MGNPGTVVYYATAVGNTPATNDPNAWIGNQWGAFNPNEWDSTNSTNDNYSKTCPAYVTAAGGPASYHGSNLYTEGGVTYSGWTVHFTVSQAQVNQGQYVILSVAMADLKSNLNVVLNLGGANAISETWAAYESGTDDAMTRSGDSAFYEWAAFEFPTTALNTVGADNTFTFGVPTSGDGVMYDALRMEITNTSANPAVTGWYDYNYINSSGTTVQNDSIGLTSNNVISVPEPGSFLAMAGVATAALVRPRRRRT